MRKHIFESLVGEDEALRIVALLAESWENVDESTWMLHLRKGVKFHDGSDFTARDFLYTACRIPTVPNSPSSMAGFVLETPSLDDAKRLLAEAGYPDGFKLILGTPNDRYINDSKIAQAVAQMLTRAGIAAEVDAMTKSVFFSRSNKYEFSLYLAGWGASGAGMASPLRALVASQNKDKGLGGTNRGRYSNPDLDAVIEQALTTVEPAAHDALLRQASGIVVEDVAILPLHFEVTPWAVRKGLTILPRADQHTVLTTVRPVQ